MTYSKSDTQQPEAYFSKEDQGHKCDKKDYSQKLLLDITVTLGTEICFIW